MTSEKHIISTLFLFIVFSFAAHAQKDSLDILLEQSGRIAPQGTFIIRKKPPVMPNSVRTLDPMPRYDHYPFLFHCRSFCGYRGRTRAKFDVLHIGYQYYDYDFVEVGYSRERRSKFADTRGFQLEFNLGQDIIGITGFLQEPLVRVNGHELLTINLDVSAYNSGSKFDLSIRPSLGFSIPRGRLSNLQLNFGYNYFPRSPVIHGVNREYVSLRYRFSFYS